MNSLAFVDKANKHIDALSLTVAKQSQTKASYQTKTSTLQQQKDYTHALVYSGKSAFWQEKVAQMQAQGFASVDKKDITAMRGEVLGEAFFKNKVDAKSIDKGISLFEDSSIKVRKNIAQFKHVIHFKPVEPLPILGKSLGYAAHGAYNAGKGYDTLENFYYHPRYGYYHITQINLDASLGHREFLSSELNNISINENPATFVSVYNKETDSGVTWLKWLDENTIYKIKIYKMIPFDKKDELLDMANSI